MSVLTTSEIQKRDRAFSLSVRARAGGRCQRCGVASGLHCAHIVGRSRWRVRWHPDNGVALCWQCHRWAHDQPHESREWFAELLGPEKWQALMDLRRPMRRREAVQQFDDDNQEGREPDGSALAAGSARAHVTAGSRGPEVGQSTQGPTAPEAW